MHITKFKGSAIGQILKHVERDRPDSARYGNENIDKDRTSQNFEVFSNVPSEEAQDKIRDAVRENEATTGKKTRRDAVVAVGVVITLPEQYKGKITSSQLRDFFLHAGRACGNLFNIKLEHCLAAVVHMDETSPHMHLLFSPVVDGKLNAKAVLNRNNLKKMHKLVDKSLQKNLPWYKGGILLSDEERTRKHSVNNQKDSMKIVEHLSSREEQLNHQSRVISNKLEELQATNEEVSKNLQEINTGKAELLALEDALASNTALYLIGNLYKLYCSKLPDDKYLRSDFFSPEANKLLEKACRISGIESPNQRRVRLEMDRGKGFTHTR